MAEDKDPFSEFGGKIVSKQVDDPFKEFGGTVVAPKKTVANGADLSGSILTNFQQPQDLTPVLPQSRDEVRNRQEYDANATSRQLTKTYKELSPETQANYDKAIQIATRRPSDQLRQPSADEIEHERFMNTGLGKTLGAAKYIGSQATKGAIEAAKGAAWLANAADYNNPLKKVNDVGITQAAEAADKAADFGLTKADQANMEDSHIIRNLGSLARIAPIAASGNLTSEGAMFALQGFGSGKTQIDQAEKNGVKINPMVKDAFILGNGAAMAALMKIPFFKSIPTGLKNDVAASVTANAIKDAAGKELTGAEFESLLNNGVKTFGDKIKQGGLNYLKSYNKAVVDLSALKTADFVLKEGVNATTDTPAFEQNLGDLASGISDVATGEAPFFAAAGVTPDMSKLVKGSGYKNSVLENLMADPSEANVQRTKDELTRVAMQDSQPWSNNELNATIDHVDRLAEVAKKLPRDIKPGKLEDAVDIAMGRDELKTQLAEAKTEREARDESIAKIATPEEQLLTDKIEQANDKLRDIATDTKTTYSKGVGDEEGKFFKTTNGTKEEITPSRYDLEVTEREAKSKAKQIDEQPKSKYELGTYYGENGHEYIIRSGNDIDGYVVQDRSTKNHDIVNVPTEELNKVNLSKTKPIEINPIESTPVKEEVLPNEKEQVSAPVDTDAVEETDTPEIKISEILDRPIIYKGEPATLLVDGQTVVAKIKDSNREYEIGNVDEVSENSIKDWDIEHQNSVVDVTDAGNIAVRGKEYVNNYSDPKSAINYDKDGNIVSVNLETTDGAKRTFKGDVAEDIAYQIHLKELNKNNETNRQFEDFFDRNEQAQATVVARENEIAAERTAVADNAPVPRKPATKRAKVTPVKETRAEKPKTVAENKSPANPKQEGVSSSQGDAGSSIKAGDPLRQFAEKVRQGKINKLGGFKASTGFDGVWDTSLEVIATSIEGGAKVVDAIDAGLKHIKQTDWYKNLTDKEQFDKEYREHLTNEYSEVERAAPAKNEANEALAKELGIEVEKTSGKRTNEVIEKEASEAIKKGYDTPDLVDRIINDNHAATDTEVAILAKYRDAKYDEYKAQEERLATDGATMSKKQFETLTQANEAALLEMQDIVQAIRKTGSITGSALRARQLDLAKEYSLANMITRKRQANGNEKLTPEQLSEVTKTVTELEKTQKELEARVKKVEGENARLKAEQALKRSAVKRQPVTKEFLAKEREVISKEFSDALRKMRSQGLNDAGAASIQFLQAAAPYVAKMTRNLAQEGVLEIKELVKRLKKELDLEDISDVDMMDLVAGKYDDVRPTKRGLQDDIRNLKTQSKLVAEIERLEKGIKTDKPEVRKTKNEQIEALRERLKQLQKEGEQSAEEKDLAALKKRIQTSIDKLSSKIAKGDFSKEPPKPPVAMDAEALELRRKYDGIKREFDLQIARDHLAQRSKTQKFIDDALNVTSLPRAMKSSFDFSAVARQGLFLAPHLREAKVALKEMFGQAFSEKKYNDWISDLKHTELYDLMKESGLYISDKSDPKLMAREEMFTSTLAERIPGVKQSERAYTAYLNVLRTGVFESEARKLMERGYTPEADPKEFESLARVINILSGRGEIPKAWGHSAPKVLSLGLFSPRFLAARLQTLYLWADPTLSKNAKILAAKDIGSVLGSAAALLTMAAAAGYSVNFNPTSTNFLKIGDEQENGTTFYDILGGLPQYVRLFSQLGSGTKTSADGNVTDLTAERGPDNPWGTTRLDVLGSFARGKMAPFPGMMFNLADGKDVIGQPYNFWPDVPMELVPLPFTDVREAYKVGGIDNALKVLVPAQLGVGASSYQPR